VYGEGQNIADRYRNVVGIFMNQLLTGEPMTVFGDGEQQRAFTHIDDVAPAISRAVDVPEARNQIFNVGADVPCTVNHLAKVVADSLGLPCKVKHLNPRDEVKVAFSDHAKADRVFGKAAKVPLERGIAAMSRWVREHGARESNVFSGIEIEKNMPPSWAAVTLKHRRPA
jgi:UDP-glucose 4-epimerase